MECLLMAHLIFPKLSKLVEALVDSSCSSSSSSSGDDEMEALLLTALRAVGEERELDETSSTHTSWTASYMENRETGTSSPPPPSRSNPLAAHLASMQSASSRPSASVHRWLMELPSLMSPGTESGPNSRARDSAGHNPVEDTTQTTSGRKRAASGADGRPGKRRQVEEKERAPRPAPFTGAPKVIPRRKIPVKPHGSLKQYDLRSPRTRTETKIQKPKPQRQNLANT